MAVDETKSFQAMGKDTTRAIKPVLAKGMTQVANSAENNANLQAALITNSERQDGPNCLTSNPGKSGVKEKHEFHEQVIDRIKEHLAAVQDDLKFVLTPALAQFALHGSALTSTVIAAPARMADLGTSILKMGMAKAEGWQMQRITEGWMLFAKFVNTQAEVAVRFFTPNFLVNTGSYVVMAEHGHQSINTNVVVSGEEIHRVAHTFALDAKEVTFLATTTAAIRSNIKTEIASTVEVDISAGATINLKAAAAINHSALSHTITDGLGGSIKVVGGMVYINSLVPPPASPPTAVVPVVPNIPVHLPGKVRVVPQYEGMSAHGTSFVG